MLAEFGQANLLQKAKAQPEKVRQVLDKIRTEGLLPTLETVFKRLDEPLPLGYCNVGRVASGEWCKGGSPGGGPCRQQWSARSMPRRKFIMILNSTHERVTVIRISRHE